MIAVEIHFVRVKMENAQRLSCGGVFSGHKILFPVIILRSSSMAV